MRCAALSLLVERGRLHLSGRVAQIIPNIPCRVSPLSAGNVSRPAVLQRPPGSVVRSVLATLSDMAEILVYLPADTNAAESTLKARPSCGREVRWSFRREFCHCLGTGCDQPGAGIGSPGTLGRSAPCCRTRPQNSDHLQATKMSPVDGARR
jgi:hypothetical protein